MLFAQISDCHVGSQGFPGGRRVNAATSLGLCVDHILALPVAPDVILATGDVVHNGSDENYVRLRACLAPLTMPVHVIPGNHDDRAAMRQAFADHVYLPAGDGPIRYVLDHGDLRLLCLDTLVPGEEYGDLDAEQLEWLDGRLREAPEVPAILVMHHPPFDIGLHRMDRIKCENGQALADLLSGHDQVIRILCGHTHRYAHAGWAGRTGITAPSTVAQLAVDLSPDGKSNWTDEPPAYLLHQWRPGDGLLTHLCQITG